MRLIAPMLMWLCLLGAWPAAAQDNWRRQDMAEAGISMLMPEKPELKLKAMGARNLTRQYLALDEIGAVAILATDMGARLPDPAIAHAASAEALRAQGITVLSQTPIEYQGEPAVDLSVQLEGMTFVVRSIYHGQWLYLIFAMPVEATTEPPPWTGRILGSVQFSKPIAQAQ